MQTMDKSMASAAGIHAIHGLGGDEKRTGKSACPPSKKKGLLRRFDDDPDVLCPARAGHVEERHRRLVIDVGRALEEHHLAGVAVQDLAHALRELVEGDLVLVDHDAL